MEKFVIYGAGRTGTTTLVDLIRLHPEVNPSRIAGELWGQDEWFLLAKNLEEFKKLFLRSYQLYDGYKLLVGHLNEQMRYHVLSSDLCTRVIFASRRNILKAAVSRMIAQQTHQWTWQQSSPEPIVDPIAITDVVRGMKIQRRAMLGREVLAKFDKAVMEIVYEDFYLVDTQAKIEKLRNLFAFLGLSPVVTNKMVKHLELGSILKPRDYFKVPNIYEIERELGSDETGWLFDGYGGLI